MAGDYIQPRLKSLCGGGTRAAYIMIAQLNYVGAMFFMGQYLHLFLTEPVKSPAVGMVQETLRHSSSLLLFLKRWCVVRLKL